MVKVALTLKKDGETKTIRAEGFSDKDAMTLINQFMGVEDKVEFQPLPGLKSVLPEPIADKPRTFANVKAVENTVPKNAVQEVEPDQEEIEEEETPKPSKRLPFLNAGRSSFSIGAITGYDEASAAVSDEEETEEERPEILPDIPNSKLTEGGVLLLRTYLECPHCGNVNDNRLSGYKNTYIKCHECQKKAKLEPATGEMQIYNSKEIPVMDEQGHYFNAVQKYEYEHEQEVEN